MPRGWKQRREYQPGAPLYAKIRLQFSGRVVEGGALIPSDYIRSARQHLTLWRSGHAGHEPRSVYAPPGVSAPPLAVSAVSAATAHETEAPAPSFDDAIAPGVVSPPTTRPKFKRH